MRYILLIIIMLTSSMTWTLDPLSVTDHTLKEDTGYSAVELVNTIDNNGDPNPKHLKYISAPNHIPDSITHAESQNAEHKFPYKLLYESGIISQAKARHTAYEMTYAQNFFTYHSQPVINELEKRLSKTPTPEVSTGYPEEQPSGCQMPIMLMAVLGGSPQLIQHLIDRGIFANLRLNTEKTVTMVDKLIHRLWNP